MKILFLGAPGSGKSTQGEMLAKDLGVEWLSSGQILREMKDPLLAKKMKAGELINDGFVTEIMLNEMEGRDDVVLDGFPRTKVQAEAIAGENIKIDKIIEIVVPIEEITQRMLGRGRIEDVEDVIKKRIEIYEKSRNEIVGVLKENGSDFVKIDGVGKIDEIFNRVKEVLK